MSHGQWSQGRFPHENLMVSTDAKKCESTRAKAAKVFAKSYENLNTHPVAESHETRLKPIEANHGTTIPCIILPWVLTNQQGPPLHLGDLLRTHEAHRSSPQEVVASRCKVSPSRYVCCYKDDGKY